MVRLIICVLLLVLACLAVTLDKTYYKVSLKELKRRARAGDRRAKQLYRAAAYDTTLQLLLWFIIVASVAVSIVLLTGIVAGWLAAIVGILIIWLAFLWLPHNRVSDLAERLTLMLTPLLFGYCIICIQPCRRSQKLSIVPEFHLPASSAKKICWNCWIGRKNSRVTLYHPQNWK
jgi:CBS domain containing-hemolysin-like protein